MNSSTDPNEGLSMNQKIIKIRNEMNIENHHLFNSHFRGDIEKATSNLSIDVKEGSQKIGLSPQFVPRKSQTCNKLILLSPHQKNVQLKRSSTMGGIQKTLMLPIIKKTVNKMRNSTFYREPSNLKDYHYDIINDNAFISDSSLSKEYSISLKVLSPFHPLMIFLKLLTFLLLLFLFLYIPLEVSFSKNFPTAFKLYINELAFTIFLIEGLFKINTGYFSNGILIIHRYKILRYYLKNFFIVDAIVLISMLTDFYVVHEEDSLFRLLKLLIFIKGSQFYALYTEIVQYLKLEKYLKGSQEVIELLFVSLFLAHLIACLWYGAAIMSLEYQVGKNKESWLYPYIIEEDWKLQYLYSFYWAVVVMMTVGFGDITPKNMIEISFCIVAIFTGCALYAYNLNSIGIILQRIYKEENEFKEELRIINNFMERKNIDSSLQTRIKEYLKFIWNEKKTQHTAKEMEIINTLSRSLKEELLLESYGGIIKAFPMLYKKFSEKTLKAMVSSMKEIRFVPGDYIFHDKELDEGCLYYINRGKVDLVIEGLKPKNLNEISYNRSVLENLQEGQVFGEFSFFTGLPRIYTAQSTEFVSLLSIKRQDFVNIVQENIEDYQQYCMIKDMLMLNDNSNDIIKKCNSCGVFDHKTLDCNLLQYIPDKEKIIKRHEFSIFQEREEFRRKRKRSKNSLILMKFNSKTACKMQIEIKKNMTLFNFTQLKPIISGVNFDSALFDSKKSLNSLENVGSNESLSSSDSEVKTISDDESSKSVVSIKENVKKCYDILTREDSIKLTINEEYNDIKETIEKLKKSSELTTDSKKTSKIAKNEINEINDKLKNISENELQKITRIASEHEKFKRLTSKATNTFISLNDCDNEKSKKNINLRKNSADKIVNTLLNVNNNNTDNNIHIATSMTKVSTHQKTSIIPKNMIDCMIFFEKWEHFDNYFTFFNIENILKIYDKKRRKLAFMKKYHPSKKSLFLKKDFDENNIENKTPLKNFGKYSFYAPHIKDKISFAKQQKSSESIDFQKKKEISKKSSNISGESPFFKSKIFQKKAVSFTALVQDLISNRLMKKKKNKL